MLLLVILVELHFSSNDWLIFTLLSLFSPVFLTRLYAGEICDFRRWKRTETRSIVWCYYPIVDWICSLSDSLNWSDQLLPTSLSHHVFLVFSLSLSLSLSWNISSHNGVSNHGAQWVANPAFTAFLLGCVCTRIAFTMRYQGLSLVLIDEHKPADRWVTYLAQL